MSWKRPDPIEARREDILDREDIRYHRIRRNAAAAVIVLGSAFLFGDGHDDTVPVPPIANFIVRIPIILGMGRLYRHNEVLLSHDNAIEQFSPVSSVEPKIDL